MLPHLLKNIGSDPMPWTDPEEDLADETRDYDVIWDDEDPDEACLIDENGGLTANGYELLATMDANGQFC